MNDGERWTLYGTTKSYGTSSEGGNVGVDRVSTVLDPVGSFAIRFTDLGEPSQFKTTIDFPGFSPKPLGGTVFHGSMAGSLTDGTPVANGVTLSPVAGKSTILTYTILNRNKQPLLDRNGKEVSISMGDGISYPRTVSSGNYGVFKSDPTFVVYCDTGIYDCSFTRMTIEFMGSGGSDRYAFTGRWDVIPALFQAQGESFDIFDRLTELAYGPAPAGETVAPADSSASVPEPSAAAPLVLLGLVGAWRTRKKHG